MEDSQRNEREFESLLHTHRAIVFKIVNTYCWRPDDRSDLAQEIATQLWRAWPKYDSARTFTTWMYRIALNVAISFVREDVRQRRVSVPLNESLHDTPVASRADPDSEDRLARLQTFIERQAPLDRALLLLYLEDKPQKEIADILGLSQTNVSTKINRLKQRLRSEI